MIAEQEKGNEIDDRPRDAPKKTRAVRSLREFRRQIREIAAANALPDYTVSFGHDADKVTL